MKGVQFNEYSYLRQQYSASPCTATATNSALYVINVISEVSGSTELSTDTSQRVLRQII